MPPSYNDFGPKTITLTVDGVPNCQDTQVVEIFFPKKATNHPGGQAGSPNWFHFWAQALATLGNTTVTYHNVAGTNGTTPAMLYWSPSMTHSKTEIWVSNHSAISNTSPFNPGIRYGIDAMADTILHENGHAVQIGQADTLVATGTGIWAKGWSWNTGSHPKWYNHYTAGPDGSPGVANVDDDGDQTVNETHDNSEYGFGDDVNLDTDRDSVPNAFESVVPAWVELYCQNLEQTRDNDHAAKDWGNPGKQHRTIVSLQPRAMHQAGRSGSWPVVR